MMSEQVSSPYALLIIPLKVVRDLFPFLFRYLHLYHSSSISLNTSITGALPEPHGVPTDQRLGNFGEIFGHIGKIGHNSIRLVAGRENDFF